MDKTYTKSQYVAAKLFFALAAISVLIGALNLRYPKAGIELAWEDYFNPLFLITIPKLIPFAASILSLCFGFAYFAFEKKFKRPINITLATLHLVLYLLAILGHATLVNFWWRVLNEEHASNLPLPLWASVLLVITFPMCCLLFGANIFLSKPRAALSTSNPR